MNIFKGIKIVLTFILFVFLPILIFDMVSWINHYNPIFLYEILKFNDSSKQLLLFLTRAIIDASFWAKQTLIFITYLCICYTFNYCNIKPTGCETK